MHLCVCEREGESENEEKATTKQQQSLSMTVSEGGKTIRTTTDSFLFSAFRASHLMIGEEKEKNIDGIFFSFLLFLHHVRHVANRKTQVEKIDVDFRSLLVEENRFR